MGERGCAMAFINGPYITQRIYTPILARISRHPKVTKKYLAVVAVVSSRRWSIINHTPLPHREVLLGLTSPIVFDSPQIQTPSHTMPAAVARGSS